MKKILLLHGANLNLLGKRDPKHYGSTTLKDIEDLVIKEAERYKLSVIVYQSNHEGYLIDKIQTESEKCSGMIINPGAFSHYSYGLYDALVDSQLPIVEVHLSKINEREEWRKQSITSLACFKTINGKKENGYVEAVEILAKYLCNDKF